MLNLFRGFGAGVASLIVVIVAWLSFTVSAVASGLPCRYDVTDVIYGPLSESIVLADAINDNEDVAGWYRHTPLSNDRAFYWTRKGGFVPIPMPAGVFESRAYDISNAGLVVGAMWSSSGVRGFIYDRHTGQMTTLYTEHGQGECQVTGVNESGVVCGFRSVNDGGDPWVPTTAFRWSVQNGFEDMTSTGYSQALAINESNQCAGWIVVDNVIRAIRWNFPGYEVMPTLVGGWSESRGISDNGTLTGFSRIPWPGAGLFGAPRCVRWVDGSIESLGTLSGFDESRGLDCNAEGFIVGDATDNNQAHSIIAKQGIMLDLNEITVFPGYFDLARAINRNGMIVTRTVLDVTFQSPSVILSPRKVVLGDANGTCNVNVEDLLLVLGQWDEGPGSAGDLDESGKVNVADLLIVIVNWTH